MEAVSFVNHAVRVVSALRPQAADHGEGVSPALFTHEAVEKNIQHLMAAQLLGWQGLQLPPYLAEHLQFQVTLRGLDDAFVGGQHVTRNSTPGALLFASATMRT